MGPDTLQECYRRYQRELYLYLRALCASAPLAEDLLQETFLRALLALPEAHTNIRAWLYRVARNPGAGPPPPGPRTGAAPPGESGGRQPRPSGAAAGG